MSETNRSNATNLSLDAAEEEEMKINLTYSSNHYYAAQYYEMMQPISPNSQALSLSLTTEDPMLYRGTQIDVNQYSAPSSSFGAWESEIESEAESMRGSKQLDLHSLGFDNHAPQSFKHNELPEVFVAGSDERPALELSPAPPAYQMESSSCFTSKLSGPVLLEALLGVVEAVGSSYQDRLTCRLHARHPAIQGMLAHQYGSISFSLSLFQHPQLTNCVLVEVQRRSGDRAAFNKLYTSILCQSIEQGLVLDESASPPSTSSSSSFNPPSFGFEDEFDEDELDRQMLSMLTAQVSAPSDMQHCHASRSAMAALIDSSSVIGQNDALAIIQSGLSSYDEQQQLSSLSLAHSVLPSLDETAQSQLLSLLLNAMDIIQISDSLSVVCYMQELTRVLSDLALSRSLKTDCELLKQRLSDKSRQWAEHTNIVQRLEHVSQHLTVI